MNNVLFGILLGFLEATFGAWKDTLFEPFSWKTFFRSPLVISIWAFILGYWIFPEGHYLLIGSSALGMERLTIEAWKAIIRKPPSKFKRSDRDIGWLRARIRNFIGD